MEDDKEYIKEEKFDADCEVKPIVTYLKDHKEILIGGELNCNDELIKDRLIEISAVLKNKSKKSEIEKNINICDNKFEISISKEDIIEMKELSAGDWYLYIRFTREEEVTDFIVKNVIEFSKEFILNYLYDKEEVLTFGIRPTNEKFNLQLIAKNEITIKQIMYILYDEKKFKIKFRTTENISKALDDKNISCCVENKIGKFYSKRIHKKGAKTFIAYFEGDNTEDFIQEAMKKGIKVTTISNNISVELIKEIDPDKVYSSFLERVQHTKRYKQLCKLLYNNIFLKMNLKKNRILFESFLGRNISGNPKYIYTELVRQNKDKDYELIWILNDTDEEIEGKHKVVKRKSLTYYYYMATAKYWIFNCRQADEIKKRSGNVYLQTWHGTPLKKLGLDMDKVNMAGQTDIEKYKEDFKKNSQTWDYLLAQNEYSKQIFKRAFAFDKEILYGYPANDILYTNNNSNSIDTIKEKLGVPKGKKVILYAPTWRDDNFYKKGHYKMDIMLDLDRMKRELGDEYIILLRMHYLITNNINIDKYKGFVYDYSQGYDIQELYLVSDVLITDYSSVMFDYSNLKRPIIFFTYDIEEYRDSLRGFYFDFESEAPGPLVVDNDGVIDALKNVDKINMEFKDKKEAFYNKFCNIDNGTAAKVILDKILK